jgi:hypothetical protein
MNRLVFLYRHTNLIPTLSNHLNKGGGVKMSVHSSNCLAPSSRITVVARQPQGIGLLTTGEPVYTLDEFSFIALTATTAPYKPFNKS